MHHSVWTIIAIIIRTQSIHYSVDYYSYYYYKSTLQLLFKVTNDFPITKSNGLCGRLYNCSYVLPLLEGKLYFLSF